MPSAANAAQREAKRLVSLTFFLDHQIGRYVVADALRAERGRCCSLFQPAGCSGGVFSKLI
ncbi:MAG: hypothetical protein A3H32_17970 [Betaproteobacteria bacterium RIFCSPLOWO2_02_FULL_63_19]|nr:MAG: hypothetical protein A3H32_17970 [Betaproteobacteria bacterium RIFCSPLOWO2_02_FULL_63_19]